VSLIIDDQTVPTDKEGYLENIGDWSETVAAAIAKEEDLLLTDAHWDIIFLLRQFYQEFELSPAMRPLVKYVGLQLGKDKGNSIYLLTLFPPSPAKIASKLAGLPRPANCL
jgi:tRNA 2-thiouridine synthesizing protein E